MAGDWRLDHWRRDGYQKRKGMTQQVLAERVGVGRDYIGRLETGKPPQPSLGLMLLIRRGFVLTETETNDLLLDTGHGYGHDQLPVLIPASFPPASEFFG